MAGALIVEGGLDDVPAIRRARERVMVFQQIAYDKNGQVEPDYYQKHIHRHDTTINGTWLPEIHMRPGEVQRWRMIHAGIETDLKLALDRHKLHEIACDGIALGRMACRDSVPLYPGYRSDVLIQASLTPGRYVLQNLPATEKEALNRIARRSATPLATVVIEGPPCPMCLPTQAELAPLAPFKPLGNPTLPVIPINFKYDDQTKVGTVNNVPFDPVAGPVLKLKLGEVRELQIHSVTESPHPFHIHVNPFEVVTYDAQRNILDRVWRDTVAVFDSPDVFIRLRCDRYTGRSVLHCHNLLHEDFGMMQTIDIEP